MSSSKAQILIVDDYPTNIKVLSDLLIDYGFEVLIARDGENALQKLQRITPDLILLDVLMPGIDGFETCQRLKSQESTQNIPVIFMTALADPVDKIKGLTLGAVDYITKPFQQEEVLARINTHLKLRSLAKQLEEQNAQLQEEARSRQLAESALRISEEKFAKAFRSNPGPMMILTLDEGKFLEINQNFCRILGYPPEAVLGKPLNELNLSVNQEECDRFFATLREKRLVHHQEWQFYTQSGEIRFLLVSAELITVRDTPCVLAMMLDITDCKQAAWDLQQAKASADLANQAKSQFLAHISHELRTPLSTILGYAQLMARTPPLSPEQQEYLNIINRSSEHLLTLINDVLEMTKIESGKLTLNETPLPLSALLTTLEGMFEPQVRNKALGFEIEVAPEVPSYLQIDEIKLRQILINLLSNAVKFTERGQVTLRVSTLPNSHPLRLVFEVEDTGPGIAPEEMEGLFDPFIQTEVGRRSQGGTGLGLPISQRFAQLMGGEISVRSQVGQGSVFHFEVPVTPVDATELASPQPRRQVTGLTPGQPTYRILVVEDQAANRQLLVKQLTTVGFEVRSVVNGEEAIAQFQTWHPDLIWMDVRMPGIDGYEVTQRIRTLESIPTPADAPPSSPPPAPTKIIALTANAFEEERMAALAAGCDDFVRKPIQEEILL